MLPDTLTLGLGALIGAAATAFFGPEVAAQTSQQASGIATTFGFQAIDMWHFVFGLVALGAILLGVMVAVMKGSENRSLRVQLNNAEHERTRSHTSTEQLQSDNGFLRDESNERHNRMLQWIGDAFGQLLDEKKRTSELSDLVGLTQEAKNKSE